MPYQSLPRSTKAIRDDRQDQQQAAAVIAKADAANDPGVRSVKGRVRAPNAIDFWRGVALVMIFVNHVPGNVFSILTLRNYAISDAAELFVFLAGCSLAYVVGAPGMRKPRLQIFGRLLMRAFEIWRAQVVVISAAIALLAACALWLNDPLLLEWHNAGPAFIDTVRSSIGLMLLTYQIGYFNILPLYVVLMLMASIMILVSRRGAILALSLALYVLTLSYELTLPSWPAEGAWHFNPLSWQLLLVLGFVCTDLARTKSEFQALVARLWRPAVAVVAFGASLVWLDIRPDPLLVPEPRLIFLFDKTFLSPVRVVSMLALAIAFYPAFAFIASKAGPPTTAVVGYMSCLGRNSLAVFSVSSVLALAGQIARYLWGASFAMDVAVVIVGLLLMRLTAWVAEYPASSRQR